MDLRALRTFRFGSTNIRRGASVTMSDSQAREHLSRRLVEEKKAPAKAEPKADGKPTPKAETK
jgi:hypothetical protein